MKNNERNDIIEVLTLAKENGCECYITPEDNHGFNYGFMIFPDETIMYVQKGDFWGFEFCIKYIPCTWCGSGCACTDDPVTEVNWEVLNALKLLGLDYARELGARKYRSAAEWKAKTYNFDKFILV